MSSKELALIKGLIESAGHRGRTYISKKLYRIWDWRLPNGQLRDISCRDLLRRLEKKEDLLNYRRRSQRHKGLAIRIKLLCPKILSQHPWAITRARASN